MERYLHGYFDGAIMITFKKFLKENDSPIFTDEEYEKNNYEVSDKIINLIKSDCKPWIQEFGGIIPLYRGVISHIPFFSKRYVREDRKPRDSGKEVHEKWNNFFKKEFNHPFRSSAVFATTNYNIAGEFGHIFLIFPIGKYSYTFSPYVSDLTYNFERKLKEFNHENGTDFNLRTVPQDIVNDIMHDFSYEIDFGLNEFLKRNVEVMINCESYYALEYSNFILNRLKNA